MHLPEPLMLQVTARFFATDAAGAEHGDALWCGLVNEGAELGFGPVRKVAEAVGTWIDSTVKAADGGLVVVAGINHQGVGVIDQGVPVLGIHVGADVGSGIHAGNPHGHDFLLAPSLETAEHRSLRPAALHLQPFKVLLAQLQLLLQMLKQALDPLLRTTDRAIDTLLGHQHRAEHSPLTGLGR